MPQRVCITLLGRPREAVAPLWIARFEAAAEPLDPLCRATVRESLGRNPAGGHALQAVVANRRGRTQRLFGVARLELDPASLEPALLRRRVAPEARETVRLQFQG